MKKIDIPDNQIQVLREFYINKAKPIYEKYQASKKQWEEIEPMLVQLGIDKGTFSTVPARPNVQAEENVLTDGYDSNWPWLKKSEFVLGRKDNLTSLEIIDVLLREYEPSMEKTKAINSLPATLSMAAKNGRILRHKKDNGEYIYQLKRKE